MDKYVKTLSEINKKYGVGDKKKIYAIAISDTKTENVFIENNPQTGIKEHEEYKWVNLSQAKNMTVYRIQKVLEWVESRLLLQK